MGQIFNESIAALLKKEAKDHDVPIVAVKADNALCDLQIKNASYRSLQLVDMNDSQGPGIYRRSVIFLFMTALNKLYPNLRAVAEHALNNGMYCRILSKNGDKAVFDKNLLEKQMRCLVDSCLPIERRVFSREEAIEIFRRNGQTSKSNLFQSSDKNNVSIYFCAGYSDYLYGPMLPNTKDLGTFAIDEYDEGVIVRTPHKGMILPPAIRQEKLAALFKEAERWAGILHCDYVDNLNDYIGNEKVGELIRISEALHEKKIAQIADQIVKNMPTLRVVFIAGPSSSGKTTFAQRLRIQLLVNGARPISISTDNYFVSRQYTPLNEKGEYDFEAFEAIDKDLLTKQIQDLLDGKPVRLPIYNFFTGEREWEEKEISLEESQPIIVEGIHGLNPRLTSALPKERIFKIYVSALTQLGIDPHNYIPTTGARLIRRIVRDYQFRGYSALHTIQQWPKVRAGEEKNIFPYQENADAMFNSAMIYELAVLKKYAYPLLKKISSNIPEYTQARQLMEFLSYFDDIYFEDDIPNNSLLREFIGKSCFF